MHKFNYSYLDNGLLPYALISIIYSLRTMSSSREVLITLTNFQKQQNF